MHTAVEAQLLEGLRQAHAMEQRAIHLLETATCLCGDAEIATIYRVHLHETEQHEALIAGRLAAYGEYPPHDVVSSLAAPLTPTAPDTAIQLANTAFVFACHEVAAYRLLEGLARHAGEDETAVVANRILKQEEAAAEAVAGTFDRALEITMHELACGPLRAVVG